MVKNKMNLDEDPDFAEAVELCFENGPEPLRSWSRTMKSVVNVFICATQIGFCCVYFVFASTSLKQVNSKYKSTTYLTF